MTGKDLRNAVRLLTAVYETLPAGSGEGVSAEELAETLNARGFATSEEGVEPALWFLNECGCVEAHGTPMARFIRSEGKR